MKYIGIITNFTQSEGSPPEFSTYPSIIHYCSVVPSYSQTTLTWALRSKKLSIIHTAHVRVV